MRRRPIPAVVLLCRSRSDPPSPAAPRPSWQSCCTASTHASAAGRCARAHVNSRASSLEECKCSDTSVAKLSTSPLGPWCEGPQLFDQMLPINSCACVSVRFWRRRRADQALSSSSVDTLDISAQRKPPVYISGGAGIPCASCHCQDCSCVGVCATAPSDLPVRLEHGDPCSLQPGLQVRCRP